MYLPFLRVIDKIRSYNWGYDCLAYFYRFECKIANVGYLPLRHVSYFFKYGVGQ